MNQTVEVKDNVVNGNGNGQEQAREVKKYACIRCKAEHALDEVVTSRETSADEADERDVIEWGLLCPVCDQWVHTHFTTAKTRKAAGQVQSALDDYRRHKNNHTLKVYRRKLGYHQKQHDRAQSRLRGKLGVKSPGQLRAEIMIEQAMAAQAQGGANGTDEEE